MKKILNKQGFTLPEVMVAAAVLGIIVLVVMQSAKLQNSNSASASADNDIASASQQIVSILNTPSGCNANFRNSNGTNLSTAGSFTPEQIFRCRSGNACTGTTSSSNTDIIFKKFNESDTGTANWKPGDTGFPSGKARIISIAGVLNTGASGSNNLVPVSITVTFQKRLGGVDLAPGSNPGFFRKLVRTFSTSVVVNGTAFQGCPKSINSTVVY